MKKFFFRLEVLLKIRRANEGTLKRDLEHAKQKLGQMQEKEKMLLAQIAYLMDEIRKKREESKLTLQETYEQILEHLNGSLNSTRQNLAAQQKQVEEQQERLKQAIQERKVIEKIKENHYAGWLSRHSQSEGALLDEIALKKQADIK